MNLVLKRQGSREEFEEVIQDIRDVLSDAKSFIQQEPLSPGEINSF